MLLSLHSLSSTVPAFLNQHQTGSLVTVQKKLWLERRRPLPTKGDRSNEEEAVRHALVVEELKQERSELMLRLTKVGGGLSWDPEKSALAKWGLLAVLLPKRSNQPTQPQPSPSLLRPGDAGVCRPWLLCALDEAGLPLGRHFERLDDCGPGYHQFRLCPAADLSRAPPAVRRLGKLNNKLYFLPLWRRYRGEHGLVCSRGRASTRKACYIRNHDVRLVCLKIFEAALAHPYLLVESRRRRRTKRSPVDFEVATCTAKAITTVTAVILRPNDGSGRSSSLRGCW